MKALLVVGLDSTLRNVFHIAKEQYPERTVEMQAIPSSDYYYFNLDVLKNYSPDIWEVCAAVNEFYINDVRRAMVDELQSLGYTTVGCISPRAYIAPTACVGIGAVIYPGSVIGADVIIGKYAVIHSNVVIAEDCKVGDFVPLEANISMREGVGVGNFTTVCANSSFTRMTQIGSQCYLNIPRQYSGGVSSKTFYSPVFEQPIRVFPVPS